MKLQAAGRSRWLVYQKIVIVFIVLLIPLVVMNIGVNYKGLAFVKDEISESAVAGASFYSKQLDNELYFIRNQQLLFMNNRDLQKLSFVGGTIENFEEVQLIDQVKDSLLTLQSSSDYVVDAGVYIKSVGKMISMMNGVENTPNDTFRMISTLMETTPKPSFYRLGDRMLFIESENNSGIMSYIEISKSKLLAALNQIAALYQKSAVLLGEEKLGSILSTTKDTDVIPTVLSLVEEQSERNANKPIIQKINGTSYFITHSQVSSLNLSLVMYVNQNELTSKLSQFTTWFYAIFAITITVLLLYSFSIHFMIHKPLSKLTKAFQMIETDNLNLSIESKRKDEFHYLFNSFNRMAYRLKRSIEENYEQKIALQHSELKQLQSQINPHFLYNSFFNIYMMCKTGDSDTAAELSQKLGSYYQYITRSGSDEVPLFKEYRHALDYCEIQCIRFSNRIRYEYAEMTDPIQSVLVPRLIIQPIVENVFEHAFEDGTMQGIVYLCVDYREQGIRVTVEDNGKSLTDEKLEQLRTKLANSAEQKEKTGMTNVNVRLQLKYGAGSGVFVSRSQHGGLQVDLLINFTKET
ncbi:sensor histidine kinase [Paenibacillus anseongense]|uniref:sensor histidine kinase n=1 Tax=Paenibacillus anseongense TaxID=2682845 RepID=UPI002DBACFD0|nr:histidine kinase [Paenibacillus anseongense]MEC0270418.1 histidine kinase [Paenibacillus anseongense]